MAKKIREAQAASARRQVNTAVTALGRFTVAAPEFQCTASEQQLPCLYLASLCLIDSTNSTLALTD